MSNYTYVQDLGNRDGMAFVIQNVNTGVVGPSTGGIGYGDNGQVEGGIPFSVAVEFDTYKVGALAIDSIALALTIRIE